MLINFIYVKLSPKKGEHLIPLTANLQLNWMESFTKDYSCATKLSLTARNYVDMNNTISHEVLNNLDIFSITHYSQLNDVLSCKLCLLEDKKMSLFSLITHHEFPLCSTHRLFIPCWPLQIKADFGLQ